LAGRGAGRIGRGPLSDECGDRDEQSLAAEERAAGQQAAIDQNAPIARVRQTLVQVSASIEAMSNDPDLGKYPCASRDRGAVGAERGNPQKNLDPAG
jgi:hypothetical protein